MVRKQDNLNYTLENQLIQHYLTVAFNLIWTIDITQYSDRVYFLFIIELSSRKVIAHQVHYNPFDTFQASSVLKQSLENFLLPTIYCRLMYVHTDCASIFNSSQWLDTLNQFQVIASHGEGKRNQNQVSERFNRTFKTILRQLILETFPDTYPKTNTERLLIKYTKGENIHLLKELTQKVIQLYNQKPHKNLFPLSPNEAYQAFKHDYINPHFIVSHQNSTDEIISTRNLNYDFDAIEMVQNINETVTNKALLPIITSISQ